MNRTLFLSKLLDLFIDVGGRESIWVPIVFSLGSSLACDFVRSVGSSISNQYDLINFILLIQWLEKDLNSFISPASFRSNSFKESAEIMRSVFISSCFQDLLKRTVVVTIDRNLNFNGSLYFTLSQHTVSPLEGGSNDFACLFQSTTHRASRI